MLLALSSFIAAGGVISDSTPAVIGAMIIAPLATPIYGVALATSIGSGRNLRNSLLLLVSGIGVNILIGILAVAITVQRMPLDLNPQIAGRTAPTLLDLMVAIAVGIAGSFALTRRLQHRRGRRHRELARAGAGGGRYHARRRPA